MSCLSYQVLARPKWEKMWQCIMIWKGLATHHRFFSHALSMSWHQGESPEAFLMPGSWPDKLSDLLPGTTFSCQCRHSSVHRYSACAQEALALLRETKREVSAENLQRLANVLEPWTNPGSCLWIAQNGKVQHESGEEKNVDVDSFSGLKLVTSGPTSNVGHPWVHLCVEHWELLVIHNRG